MIIPPFELKQTDTEVIITVHAPYTRIKDTEIYIFEEDFRFYSAPYLLSLTLPGKVEEAESSSARYDINSGTFVINLSKMTPGEYFPKLEMLTTMFHPSKESTSKTRPLIEPMEEEGAVGGVDPAAVFSQECEESDADNGVYNGMIHDRDDRLGILESSLDRHLKEDKPDFVSKFLKFKYGFGRLHSGLDNKYEVELSTVSEIKNPDAVPPKERQHMQEIIENRKFSDDHYLGDLEYPEELATQLNFKLKRKHFTALSKADNMLLKDLPNRSFDLLDLSDIRQVSFQLVDIIYAFLFDFTLNEGTHCVESPWNVSRVSATLSWFREFNSITEVVRSCTRRSLSYPLVRHWSFTQKILRDTIKVLKWGGVAVLKCMLEIRRMFNKNSPFYLLNQLYIDDYCIWIQKQNEKFWGILGSKMEQAVSRLTKADVGFDLVALEAAAKAVEEEEMEERLSLGLHKVTLF